MWRCLLIACIVGAFGISTRAEQDPLAALLARTDAVAKEVSKIRGLPFKKKIENEVLDRYQLRARLLEIAADQKTQTETRAEGLALARWGMIPLDTDYLKLMIELLTDQIAGYYDPKTKRLTISRHAGDDPDWAEMVLAHELDHGLQDQKYDLEKFEDLPATEGDAAMARHALVEGDGVALMIEVMLARKKIPAPWRDPSIAAELEKAMGVPNGDILERAPLAVREALMFPYRAGFAFVASLRRKKPWSAIDAAFKRPPRSTEHIMHPEKYLVDELPIAITLDTPSALAGYKLVHNTVWGELGFQLFLRAHGLATEMSKQAAAGWGGDRVIIVAKGERTVGLARFDWDSEADAIEAHEAAVRALDAAIIGGTAEHSDTRTRWLAVDGNVAFAERRGTSLVLAIGVPARAADAVQRELWANSR